MDIFKRSQFGRHSWVNTGVKHGDFEGTRRSDTRSEGLYPKSLTHCLLHAHYLGEFYVADYIMPSSAKLKNTFGDCFSRT